MKLFKIKSGKEIGLLKKLIKDAILDGMLKTIQRRQIIIFSHKKVRIQN